MALLVTSAAGTNGDGYGALLAFDGDGKSLGAFSDDSRIADPRGLAVDPSEGLLFLNSGSDRVLALSADGIVVRDTGQMEGLNPGGGNFGPDGRYFVGSGSRSTVIAFAPALDAAGEHFLPAAIVPFPRGFAFGHDGRFFLASGIDPNGVGDDAVVAFDPVSAWGRSGWSATRNSALLISRSHPTATSSYRESTRSARQVPR